MNARALKPGLIALTLIGASYVFTKFLYYWLAYPVGEDSQLENLALVYIGVALSNVLAGSLLVLRELWARRFRPLCVGLVGAALLSWGALQAAESLRCTTVTVILASVLLIWCFMYAADRFELRHSPGGPPRRRRGPVWFRSGLSVASTLVLWYFSSFAAFFSLDDSFTRVGGTTPYCYARPFLVAYEPLLRTAWSLGWHGGGVENEGISTVDLMDF